MKIKLLSLGLAAMILWQGLLPALSVFAQSDETSTEPPASDEVVETEPITEEPVAPEDIDYTHEISDAGLELIKSFEGYSRYPYWDYKQ